LILGDGAPWIWNIADTYLPGVPQLLDFLSCLRASVCHSQSDMGGQNSHRWWQHRLRQLKEGKIDNFFDALKRLARTHNTDAPDISPKRLLQYFQENRDR